MKNFILVVVLTVVFISCGSSDGENGIGGKDGKDGVSCWDLNGDFECTLPAEDLNDDGLCSVIDCFGKNGEDGIKGDGGSAGENGENGESGVHCWDLNGDGLCTIPAEDIDDSGDCNVSDCSGKDGADGADGEENIYEWVVEPSADRADTDKIKPVILAALADSSGAVIYLKPGIHYITTEILLTAEELSGKSIHIQGAGPEITEIRQIGTTGTLHGIHIYADDVAKQVMLRDFSLTTESSGGYYGVALERASNIGGWDGRILHVEDLIISGHESLNDYWSVGIGLLNGWYTYIVDTSIWGSSDAGHRFDAQYGIYVGGGSTVDALSGSVNTHIMAVNITFYETGVFITGNTEGVTVKDSTLAETNKGIHWLSEAHSSVPDGSVKGEPQLTATGNHIDADGYGVLLVDNMSSQIANNFIFTDSCATNAYGIEMIYGAGNTVRFGNSTITGNSIMDRCATGNSSSYGIKVDTQGNTVTGNSIQAVTPGKPLNAGIYLGTNSKGCAVTGNSIGYSSVGIENHGSSNQADESLNAIWN